jgi:hypothetical protein
MIAARTGHRTRVLRYLLSLVGITSDLVFARNDHREEPGAVPDLGLYDAVMLQVDVGSDTPRYVFAEAKFLPLSFIPPALRGSEGIVLAADNPRVTLPDPGPAADRRDTDIDITLTDTGARVRIVETHRGSSALFWRQQLEEIPHADLDRGFEQAYAARVIPGSNLEDLAVEGIDDYESPLVLRYELRVAELGRRTNDALHVPPLFATNLASRYATLPSRATTQSVSGVHQRVRLRLRGPADAPAEPTGAQFDGPGGAHFVQRSRVNGETLLLERTLDVPRQLVPVDAYAELAEFCRRVDALEAGEIGVPLR